MQVTKQQLERQQLILKVLGFYSGTVDGVWGPDTIVAKKRYEASPSFVPGIPANGLPFAEGRMYPNGVSLRKDGLLYHPAIEPMLNVAKASVVPTPSQPEVTEITPSAAPEAKPVVTKK